MPQEPSDWQVYFDRRTTIVGRVCRDVEENLRTRGRGPRDPNDDDVFRPLTTATVIAISEQDYRLAIELFNRVFEVVGRYEEPPDVEFHKGAPTFNVGVAYLRNYDFRAAMHYLQVAEDETNRTRRGQHHNIYLDHLFDRNFWATVDAAAGRYPNRHYEELWGRPLDAAAGKADWAKLTTNSKLLYIITSAERIRYRQLADLSPRRADTESLRLAYWNLAADAARLVETEARHRSTSKDANTLLAMLSKGFKKGRLGDLSKYVQNLHDNVYKVKDGPRYNAHYKTIMGIVRDRARPELERVGHAVYLLGVTRNQVAHSVDQTLVLYQDITAAQDVTDLLFAMANLDGWTK